MSSTRTMGISVTDVSTAADGAKLPLGFEYHEPASGDDTGAKVWIYVEAASAFDQGAIAIRAAGIQTAKVIENPGDADIPAVRVMGVAQHTIASGSFGFILRRGIGEVQKDNAGIAADVELICTDAGTGHAGRACINSGGGTSDVFAFGLDADSATVGGELITSLIDCRG